MHVYSSLHLLLFNYLKQMKVLSLLDEMTQ
jgi:hypothetical protein